MEQRLESLHEAALTGYTPVVALRAGQRPDYLERLKRFAEVYHDYLNAGGDTYYRARARLREAMGTSEFPLLFGDTLQRILTEKFQAATHDWEKYIKVSTAPDFRAVERYRVGGGSGLLSVVAEGESYPQDNLTEAKVSWALKKYGRVRSFFWEALVNDDLGALRDAPAELAAMATNTENYVATSLYAANATLYSAAHSVNGTNYSNVTTAPLTLTDLVSAISEMGMFPGDDADSLIINNTPRYIVVGTLGMKLKAEQLLQSPAVMYVGATDLGNLPPANLLGTLRDSLEVIYNPFLSHFDSNYKTAWYLFTDPANGYSVECSRLAGQETPVLFMRASAQMALAGGLANPLLGNFDNDTVDYRIRHCFGGAHLNAIGGWRFTYYSDGTGGVQ